MRLSQATSICSSRVSGSVLSRRMPICPETRSLRPLEKCSAPWLYRDAGAMTVGGLKKRGMNTLSPLRRGAALAVLVPVGDKT